jgi:hypothetical protein
LRRIALGLSLQLSPRLKKILHQAAATIGKNAFGDLEAMV